MIQKSFIAVSAGVLLYAGVVSAQEAPAAPPAQTQAAEAQKEPEGGMPAFVRAETPEERRLRLGTEDPGLDPDPKKHFWRFGKSYHIEKFERKFASYDQPAGFVRPWGFSSAIFEVYQQNERFVWVWVPDPVAAEEPLPAVAVDPLNDATYEFLARVRPQYTPLIPETAKKTIRFEESSTGLPATGSWRNSGAVADMNGDKCPDIVAPPERKGNGIPAIFLGDCKGKWRYWSEAQFPLRLDYGSVVAADFNKDSKMDLAFAVHLNGVFVLLGDGKGGFTDASKGLPRDFATRRVIATDIDRDGDVDLIASNEGPTDVEFGGGAPVRAFENRNGAKEWQQIAIASPDIRVGGDWLSAGNFNGDRYPDIFVASVYFGSVNVAYLSSGAKNWKPVESDGDLIPSQSYYYASTMGKFTSKKRDDAIISYVRFWPSGVNPQRVAPPKLNDVLNIDRVSFENGKIKRYSIARWVGAGVSAMSNGDFDGDGNLDIIYVNDRPREAVVLLGDGRGSFSAAPVEGLPVALNPVYDLKVADVNVDGKPDVLLMYESGGKSLVDRTGSIRVFLGKGAEATTAASAK